MDFLIRILFLLGFAAFISAICGIVILIRHIKGTGSRTGTETTFKVGCIVFVIAILLFSLSEVFSISIDKTAKFSLVIVGLFVSLLIVYFSLFYPSTRRRKMEYRANLYSMLGFIDGLSLSGAPFHQNLRAFKSQAIIDFTTHSVDKPERIEYTVSSRERYSAYPDNYHLFSVISIIQHADYLGYEDLKLFCVDVLRKAGSYDSGNRDFLHYC